MYIKKNILLNGCFFVSSRFSQSFEMCLMYSTTFLLVFLLIFDKCQSVFLKFETTTILKSTWIPSQSIQNLAWVSFLIFSSFVSNAS
jgi:hypothetical protein